MLKLKYIYPIQFQIMKKFIPFYLILLLLGFSLTIFKCSNKKISSSPSLFTEVISGYSGGVISNNSSIKLRFMDPVKSEVQDAVINEELFQFEPEIKGSNNWVDDYTIEFIPDELLVSGTEFEGFFDINKVIENKNLPSFSFEFQTLKQSIFPNLIGLQQAFEDSYKYLIYNAELETADYADFESISSVIKATQDGAPLAVKWEFSDENNKHRFYIDSIVRYENESAVQIFWDGSSINSSEKGNQNITIPALGDFKLINITTRNLPDQRISLHFSDPIKTNQNLKGLISLKNHNGSLSYSIEGNDIHVYSNQSLVGDHTINIEKSILNTLRKPLKQSHEQNIHFDNIKPAVELVSNGVIMPSTNGLIFPFKAVSLKAVNVKIIKIYENNIVQFLQDNHYNGYSNINRVGNIVYKKAVDLISDKAINYANWNTFSLDLSKLINVEKGAIYRVVIGFDKSQSLFQCEDDGNDDENLTEYSINDKDIETFSGPGRYYNDMDYYDNYYYDWYERDNPCNLSYYRNRSNIIATNVLSSDLGIIAKSAEGRFLNAYVTNLKSTAPIANVTIDVLDYQSQKIASSTTDENGMVKIDLSKKPFLLVAKNNNERGYLKLDDGNSLSLSMFDVSGQQIKKGIKGYIYGERGVWRPGDSLFLSFILEDKENLLPEDQPVVFELFGPDNQLRQRKVRTHGLNGFYDFRTATENNDKTGNWRAQVSVGGSIFSKLVKVETVKPNRLKIKMDFNGKKIVDPYENKDGTIQVNWLHGAIAKDLFTTVELNLISGKTSFDDYYGYTFDDPSKNFYANDEVVYEGNTDENGQINFQPDISIKSNAPGMLRANFKTRVFEKGGDFSTDNYSIKYSPFEGYVGVKVPEGKGWNGAIFSNETNAIPIVTVDAKGNPIDRKNLEIEVFDIRWRWWWERNNYNDIASYISNRSANLLLSDKISTVNGKATYKLNFGENLWGRKFIKVTDPVTGHSTGKIFYVTYSGWWNRSGGDNSINAEMLAFSLDKKSYNVGEIVKLDLPNFTSGRALVSVESSTGVVSSFWVTNEEAKNGIELEATSAMTPNVFIHVALVQPHSVKGNDLPIRLYGVQPIRVIDEQTTLQPEIEMPEEIAPESEFSVTVSEKNGSPMTYTIAVVDEGLLDLTNFKTPQPWNYFYAREALGVKTWDMYKYVINANSGEMAGLLALGGDEEGDGEKESSKVNRFKPVVKFLGPFELEDGDDRTHKIQMPNYVGSVKTMVIAGNKGSYGSVDQTTPVRKPLMVLATLPRLVSPSEIVELPVNVFAMDEKIKNVSIKVTTNDMLTLENGNSSQLSFERPDDKIANFRLKVAEKVGVAKVKVVVKSGKHEAKHEIELEVRTPNPIVSEFENTVLEPGKSWNFNYQNIGIYGTNEGVVEVTSVPPLNLDDRLKYLIRYPHGCIEQTTSSVFPQLSLSDVMDLKENEIKAIENNIKAGIKRLKKFQVSSGGLSYWPGENEASSWGTNYGGHFLVECKANGYNVPDAMIKGIVKYQKKHANSWNGDDGYYSHAHGRQSNEIIQAYRLYILALADKPALGAMNRMKSMKNLSLAAKWRLAGAYALIGKKNVALSIVNDLATNVEYYKEMHHSYGSSVRDEAMILEVLTLLGENSKGKKLFDKLSENMASKSWYSTQTTAYTLLAISNFIGDSQFDGLDYKVAVNGNSTFVKSEKAIHQTELSFNYGKTNTINITNNSKTPLYVKVQNTGVPLVGNIKEEENNMQMTVQYLDMNENRIDPSVMEQGSDFIAQVTIRNTSYQSINQIALSQMFPSGWEIRNTRMDNSSSTLLRDKPDYQDFRDDRVYSYFNLNRNQSKTFRVILNASYLGEFYLPITYCEAMYDNEYFSRKAGGKVKVINAGDDLSEN